ncbi:MAG: SdpI family protein [Blautia sp.]|nr:SdpI family protein [Eubacteriales bacterium]MED9965692.1 SdpI family protein [Blautia sp.]
MRKHKTMIITTLICLIPMIVAALVYDRLPEQMVTHWGNNGPNGYSPKAFACFGLPGIMVGLNLLVYFMMENDPKRKNYSHTLRKLIVYVIPVMTLVTSAVTIGTGLGITFQVNLIMPVFVGIILIIIGNYLPKCKQNYTMGIKCPWTLNSEENWNKTHHLGGYLTILAGILMMFGGLSDVTQVLAFVGVIAAALIPFGYSFWLYKKGI